MGSKKTVKSKVFHIDVRKRATVTKYKGKLYCHFADQFSKKTITFNYDELKKLKKVLPSILEMVKAHEKKQQKKKGHETGMEDQGNSSPYHTEEDISSSSDSE